MQCAVNVERNEHTNKPNRKSYRTSNSIRSCVGSKCLFFYFFIRSKFQNENTMRNERTECESGIYRFSEGVCVCVICVCARARGYIVIMCTCRKRMAKLNNLRR